MKSFFCEVGRDERDDHHNGSGHSSALQQRPAPGFLKQINKHEINQRKRTPHHIWNCSGSGSTKISTELLCTHRYKDCPESGAETQTRANDIHTGVVVIPPAKENNSPNNCHHVKKVECFFSTLEILTNESY